MTKTTPTKTHWKQLTNPDYLGAYSMPADQTTFLLTIKEVKREMVTGPDGKKEECTVAHFKEDQKPMILNVTNCKAIAKLCDSPYIEEWTGCSVIIYVAKVKAFGEMVEALRIRSEKDLKRKPELTPQHKQWTGAKQAISTGDVDIEELEKHFTISDKNIEILCKK